MTETMRSLGVSRTLVIDGKALQSNILAVLEIESQKLRMENESRCFFLVMVRWRQSVRSKAIRLMVSSSWLEMHKRPLKGIIRIKMIGSLFENRISAGSSVFPALLQNSPAGAACSSGLFLRKEFHSLLHEMFSYVVFLSLFAIVVKYPAAWQRGILISFYSFTEPTSTPFTKYF